MKQYIPKIFFVLVVLVLVVAGARLSGKDQGAQAEESLRITFLAHDAHAEVGMSDSLLVPQGVVLVLSPESKKEEAPTGTIDLTVLKDIAPQLVPTPASATQKTVKEDQGPALPADANLLRGLLVSESAVGISAFHKKSDTPAPEIEAQIGLVADLETGETYFELNPNKPWPMASITKLITAVFALVHMDAKSRVTLSGDATALGDTTVAKPIQLGDIYEVWDMNSLMLLLSSNEAAESLAGAYGRESFISGMRDLVRGWGIDAITFVDPTGLSSGNLATAQALRKMAAMVAKEYPTILQTTRKPKVSIRELGAKRVVTVKNINLFAGQADFVGGKTGFTDEARGNLLSIFSYKKRSVAVVVMGSEDRFGETEKLWNWFKLTYN